MNVTGPFVLERDVLLIPCAELSADARARITHDAGDYTLSRRHGRSLSQVIDGDTAALLALFREPRTIVDAVLENSLALGVDARARLDELLPHLGAFVHRRVLVPAGAEAAQEIRPHYESGAVVAGWKLVRCASLMDDSEVHQLRRGDEVAALKIARTDSKRTREVVENEIAVLRHLAGCTAVPRLLDEGLHDGRRYAIVEWMEGVDAEVAAAQRRHDRPALLELCASIAAAYAELHGRGVLHGDVHPRNVIAGARATLIDFGVAQVAGTEAQVERGGVFAYFEPEFLAALRERRSAPPTAAGEQYALAAMLYALITGGPYLDFRFDREEMTRQVECEPPLPFAQRGVPPWPEVERVLFRALEKDPARRHGSVAELAARLAAARDATRRESVSTPLGAEAHALLDDALRAFARGGEMFVARYPTPPRASINYGCAGAAVGLLRIAETRGDPALLALADVWRSRAAALLEDDGAYYNEADELPRAVLGNITPYHTEAGIHAAAAMVAAAMGDTAATAAAVHAFVRASQRPCAQLDLTLGRSGSLLAAAMLLPIAPAGAAETALRAFGAETMRAVWSGLPPSIAASPRSTYLGVAHGWSGYLYAALRWVAASADAPPAGIVDRLHEFAGRRLHDGRGAWWHTMVGSSVYGGTWCNGSAGPVFLFTLAHALFGDDEWLRVAELAAWSTFDAPRTATSLCCGTAGRAYALLDFYQHTGATEWLGRARQLANHAAAHAAATSQRRYSLWKGELGPAVLVADLAAPEHAGMPFF